MLFDDLTQVLCGRGPLGGRFPSKQQRPARAGGREGARLPPSPPPPPPPPHRRRRPCATSALPAAAVGRRARPQAAHGDEQLQRQLHPGAAHPGGGRAAAHQYPHAQHNPADRAHQQEAGAGRRAGARAGAAVRRARHTCARTCARADASDRALQKARFPPASRWTPPTPAATRPPASTRAGPHPRRPEAHQPAGRGQHRPLRVAPRAAADERAAAAAARERRGHLRRALLPQRRPGAALCGGPWGWAWMKLLAAVQPSTHHVRALALELPLPYAHYATLCCTPHQPMPHQPTPRFQTPFKRVQTPQTEFTEVSAYLKEVADLLGGGLMRMLSSELANEYEVRRGGMLNAGARPGRGSRAACARARRVPPARPPASGRPLTRPAPRALVPRPLPRGARSPCRRCLRMRSCPLRSWRAPTAARSAARPTTAATPTTARRSRRGPRGSAAAGRRRRTAGTTCRARAAAGPACASTPSSSAAPSARRAAA
jgi:hypothetical protein